MAVLTEKEAFEVEVYAAENWEQQWINAQFNEDCGFFEKYPIANTLFRECADRDILVVCAGPSMWHEFGYIRKWHDRGGVIVCVDRALPTLIDNGIFPGYCISGEKSNAVCKWIIPCLEKDNTKNVKFVLPVWGDGDLWNALDFEGCDLHWYVPFSCHCFFANGWEETRGPEACCILAGRIIGFTACDFAARLGAKRVITIGNDLSAGPAKQYFSIKESTVNNLIEVDDGHGNKVMTAPSFYQASLREFPFLTQKHPDIEFVDCSGGLDKAGWKKTTMKEILS